MIFLEGYLVGLGLILLIGPVFFTLLQSTLQYDYKSGLAVALGIFVSDVMCVLLCSFGAAPLLEQNHNQLIFSCLGAVILFGFGLKFLLKPSLNFETSLQLKATDYINFFIKGFLVNFVNPFVFIVWIGIIGLASAKYNTNQTLGVYLTGVLLGILTTDTLKALFAHNIKILLQPKYLQILYRIVAICLLGFGFRLLYVAYTLI
ncbi:MAG: LysE family translocator [Chitinophagales bacterium]